MISVVIPTYKNRKQFLDNLNLNLVFLKKTEIIIVNDNPELPLKNTMNKHAHITVIENKKNLGFGNSVNKGIEKANHPFVMLLNDDVILQDSSYEDTAEQFGNDPQLFAISFAQMDKNNETVGKNRIFWKNGLFYHGKNPNLNRGITAWAEGGSCIIDKKKFLALKGFDPAYSPFYWEDIDLSYRAWKKGYSILFDPSVKVIHHHESTINTFFSRKYVKTIAFRNQFVFIRKNITELRYVLEFWLLLPFNLCYYLVKGEYAFIGGFIQSLSVRFSKESYSVSDTKILKNLS